MDLLEAEQPFFAPEGDAAGFFDCEFMEVSPVAEQSIPAFAEHPSTSEELAESPTASPLRLEPDLPFPVAPEEVSVSGDDLFSPSFASELPVPMDIVAEREDAPAPQGDVASPSAGEQRGRKRKAEPQPNMKVAKVKLEPGRSLSKEEIAAMSAEELEEYAQQISNSHMTTSEKNELRRQLRLIKNRESAQASRLRKKSYIEELERKVSALATENQRLRTSITTLNSENTSLKSQVDYLHKFVGSTGLGKVLQAGASMLAKAVQKPTPPAGKDQKEQPSLNPRAASMILMVMLFSFGLLFNAQLNQQKALPMSTAMVPASPGRVLEHPHFKPTSENRKLHQLYENQEMPTQRILKRIEQHGEMPSATSHSIRTDEAPAVHPAAAKLATVKPVIVDWKANTTYLLCPEVQKLTPPVGVPEDPSAPLQLAFLIPPDALGNTPTGRREYLEVTCQVSDVSTRPMHVEDASAHA